jgi:hypothetical protein
MRGHGVQGQEAAVERRLGAVVAVGEEGAVLLQHRRELRFLGQADEQLPRL